MKHKFIISKMKKGKPLINDRYLFRYVPITKWYLDSTLNQMRKEYKQLYLKPDKGQSGSGIIRIKKLTRGKSLISFKGTSQKCLNHNIVSEVKKKMRRDKKYIIQQGISLATYQNKPFDLRIVLQKPRDRWLITWMSAKVAPRSNSIVTNVARGAKDAKIKRALQGADQPLNVPKTLKKLTAVSYKIAKKLGSRFPLRIIGLDMGIDKKGKIWFIEANTKPSFHGLKKFDPIQYRRYFRAKKQIESGK